MKNKKIIFLVITLKFLFSCSESIEENIIDNNLYFKNAPIITNMLWNPHLEKKAFVYYNNMDLISNYRCLKNYTYDDNYFNSISNLSENHLLNKVKSRNHTYFDYSTNYSFTSLDNSAHSMLWTSFRYCPTLYGQYPGFDMWFDGLTYNHPVWTFKNNSLGLSAINREVGLVLNHYTTEGEIGQWSFKEEYQIHDFDEIKFDADIKLNTYRVNSNNEVNNLIRVDFRVVYLNNDRSIAKSDLLGILISNLSNTDYFGVIGDGYYAKTSSIAPSGYTREKVEIVASELNLDNLDDNLQIDSNGVKSNPDFININFDLKSLLLLHLNNPPNNFSIDDAVIVGLDLYSNTRKSDITFAVKGLNVTGVNN